MRERAGCLFSKGYGDYPLKQLWPLWSCTLYKCATVYMSCVKNRGSVVIFNPCIQHHREAEPATDIPLAEKSSSALNDKNHDFEKNSCKTRSPAILSLRFTFFFLPFILRGQISLSPFLTAILSNIMNVDNNLRNRKGAWKIYLKAKIWTVLHITIAIVSAI